MATPPHLAALPLGYQASSFHFISGQTGAEVGSPAPSFDSKMFSIVQNAFALSSGRD